jgi:hypothetical protein
VLCTGYAVKHGSPTFFLKGPQLLLWTGSRAARVKITVYGTPNRLNLKIVNIMESSYKNATLFYYVTALTRGSIVLIKI